jgi:hypothetical protein
VVPPGDILPSKLGTEGLASAEHFSLDFGPEAHDFVVKVGILHVA